MKEIPLTQRKVALVDNEDFETLWKHKRCAHKAKNTRFTLLTNRETISQAL